MGIKEVSSVKYLGITINSNWSEHIVKITSKAYLSFGFRITKETLKCPTNIKISCCKSLVLPILEYGCTIWDPYINKDIKNLEKVQEGHAARFILNDYSWNSYQCISTIKFPKSTKLKVKFKGYYVYKIIHDLAT